MDNEPLILVMYVDDLFLTGNEKLIEWCKKKLASEFEMKDLGLMHYFLGLEVWRRKKEIFLSQGKYIIDILDVGLQVHGYSNGCESREVGGICFIF